MQPLHDARGLAAADSVEGFVLGYTSVLEAYPGALEHVACAPGMLAMFSMCWMQCTSPSVLEAEQLESRRHGGMGHGMAVCRSFTAGGSELNLLAVHSCRPGAISGGEPRTGTC